MVSASKKPKPFSTIPTQSPSLTPNIPFPKTVGLIWVSPADHAFSMSFIQNVEKPPASSVAVQLPPESGKFMNSNTNDLDDDLMPEYDFRDQRNPAFQPGRWRNYA
jgi:hypothetical protein